MWLSIQLVGTECLRLKIDGTLDVTTVPVLEPMLVSVVDRRPRYVELDLSRLRTIDVVGAGALLGFYKRLRTAGSVFNWSGLCDQPLAAFRMLRLDRHLGDVDLEACWS
jgi:anti-anti-sigma regulatory factor